HLLKGSATGSLDDPTFIPPYTHTGGTAWPFDWTIKRQQVDAKTTYYADHFLKSQHEFKFGAQYAYRLADTITAYGPNGAFNLDYPGIVSYTYYQPPFHYGAISHDLGFFLDDTVTASRRLTLNLGVRFDHNTGAIPEYDLLQVGTPSITSIGNF